MTVHSYESQCSGKRRYADEESARLVIYLMQTARKRPVKLRLNAYPCPYCECWHVGKVRAQSPSLSDSN